MGRRGQRGGVGGGCWRVLRVDAWSPPRGGYGSAIEVMRRQKVDLNLLVDMNPDRFLLPAGGGGVGGGAHYYNRVVNQVKEIDRINLFLSNHKDCNVTEWKYKVPSWINRNCRRMSEEEKKNEEEGEEETMTTEEEEEYGEGESVRPIRYDFSDKINRVW